MQRIYTTQDYTNKPLRCMERVYVKKAMNKHDGHRIRAAKDLGISTRTLSTYIIQHSI